MSHLSEVILCSRQIKGPVTFDFLLYEVEFYSSYYSLWVQRLQAKIIKIVDVSYGGENGFNQAIELAAEALGNVKFIQEKKLIGKNWEFIHSFEGAQMNIMLNAALNVYVVVLYCELQVIVFLYVESLSFTSVFPSYCLDFTFFTKFIVFLLHNLYDFIEVIYWDYSITILFQDYSVIAEQENIVQMVII